MSRARPMLSSSMLVPSLGAGVLSEDAAGAVLIDAVTHPIETLLLILAVAFAAQLIGRLTARGVKYLIEYADAIRARLTMQPATQRVPVTTQPPVPPGPAPGLQ